MLLAITYFYSCSSSYSRNSYCYCYCCYCCYFLYSMNPYPYPQVNMFVLMTNLAIGAFRFFGSLIYLVVVINQSSLLLPHKPAELILLAVFLLAVFFFAVFILTFLLAILLLSVFFLAVFSLAVFNFFLADLINPCELATGGHRQVCLEKTFCKQVWLNKSIFVWKCQKPYTL